MARLLACPLQPQEMGKPEGWGSWALDMGANSHNRVSSSLLRNLAP